MNTNLNGREGNILRLGLLLRRLPRLFDLLHSLSCLLRVSERKKADY